MIRELVALFPVVPRSSARYWSTLLLNKLAALRKHDVRDVGCWDEHAAAIMTQMTARFELPIGNAQGAPPFFRAVPQECSSMFSYEQHGRPVRERKSALKVRLSALSSAPPGVRAFSSLVLGS